MNEWDGWFWRWGMWNRWSGWWRPRVRVVDALGRECRVDVEGLGEFAKSLPPGRGRPLFWSTLSPRFVVAVFALGVWALAVVVGAITLGAIVGNRKPGNGEFLTMLVVFPSPFIALGCMALLGPVFRSRHARKHCLAACAAAEVCPNCHYDLKGLEAVEGAVTCPECGFAWRTGQGAGSPSSRTS